MPSDVRRSARGAPPPTKPPAPGHTSSSSSLSSARQDRSARGTGTQKSATPHSLSSEDPADQPRRSQRSAPAKADEDVKPNDEPEEDAGEEEEITRCICGHQEYPGPPLSEAFNAADAQSEDAGGLFISCDGCSVWQHGGCVGIIEDAQVPDKYYCEECKPKQHELHTDSRGQSYSLYQPIYAKLNRKGSISKSSDKGQRERENTASRASADPLTGKRRATMRSKEHDDEEEQMRQAIEESRREVDIGTGRRNGKRSREDNEDNKHSIKRQRTESESIPANARKVSSEDESESETAGFSTGKSKKARAEAAQTARQVEQREKDKERERARNEAAGRRQERAGRRRADDDPADETPKPTSTRTSPPPSSQPASPPHLVPEKPSHKKGAGKKTKKLGNNQYTKLREMGIAPSSSPHSKKRQLAKDAQGTLSSGDEQGLPNGETTHTSNSTSKNSPDHPNGSGNGKGVGTGNNRFGKGGGKKNGMHGVNGVYKGGGLLENGERTLASMNRSIDAMARSIAAAQLEMAGSWTPPTGAVTSGAGVAPTSEPLPGMDGVGGGGGDGGGRTNGVSGEGGIALGEDGKAPEGVSAMEMADWVSRGIHEWQRRFGHLV